MNLVSINLGHKEKLASSLYTKPTGIQKRSVPSAAISEAGVAGDYVADGRHHGGPDQAVYVYSVDDYAWWAVQLGEALLPGTFGENLTVSGLESAKLRIGGRLRFANLLLEVTAPRIPCNTLAARMDDADFVKRFRAAGRPGAYCRVIEAGIVKVGEAVSLEEANASDLTLLELYNFWYDKVKLSPVQLERVLAAPVAVRVRTAFMERLEKLHAAL
jgi:MOSC domain-containing protein YiiM